MVGRVGAVLLLGLGLLCCFAVGATQYRLGVGIWDVTGPAAEIGMMGYAMPNQKTAGIHFRLRARAFIFDDSKTRIVYVSSDTCMIFFAVKDKVVARLREEFGDLYTHENVMLSGIHTHSGPAGFSYNVLYLVTSFGFHKDNFDVIVEGIFQAIRMAHYDMTTGGSVLWNNGTLLEANINRSPTAYLHNTAEERAKYDYDVDKVMTVLKLLDQSGKELGLLNWFAVHGTAMNNTNMLISGDNKGYASYLVEKRKNGPAALPGFGPFVAAFAQTNEGDVSPNTRGARCPDGSPCDSPTSTCGGKNEGCKASGPGKDMFESTQIIGTKQADAAMALFDAAKTPLDGPVSFVHSFVDFTQVKVSAEFTSTHKPETTCQGALGDSFAAGTTDGPGMFDFTQGTNSTSKNPFWNFIAHFLSAPSAEQVKCQHPKPILLNIGGISLPAPWCASIIPIQLFRVGQLFIIGVPGEFTTMSGRRLRDTVRAALVKNGLANENAVVVISGLSNEYTHYVTTFEEYQAQRYEGASTIFGPHTLAAYQQEFTRLVEAMAAGIKPNTTAAPQDLSSKTFNLQPGVVFDTAPSSGFGSVHVDADATPAKGSLISVEFWGANPRNNMMNQKSFCTVEKKADNGQWVPVFTDGDWDTKFTWKREGISRSYCTCQWQTYPTTEPGVYRISHAGFYKSALSGIKPYSGVSRPFTLN